MKSKPLLIATEILAASPKTVVDVGYAQLPNLFLKDVRVFGIDLVEAPSPYEKTYIVDLNTDRLPFNDGAIDAVAMGCTLAHVSNPLKVLGEINRILPVDGTLVISSPNPNYYWETVLNVFYHHFKNRVSQAKHYEHFFEFSRYNMRTIAERSGFEVVKEIGCTFKLVKTSISFHPLRHPGFAYEIIYTLKKKGSPESFATFESAAGIERIPTRFF
jgi:SAM-dependent methyltransferase